MHLPMLGIQGASQHGVVYEVVTVLSADLATNDDTSSIALVSRLINERFVAAREEAYSERYFIVCGAAHWGKIKVVSGIDVKLRDQEEWVQVVVSHVRL